MPTTIPEQFRDLFTKKAFAHLATVGADGAPQVTPVWVDFDGTHVRFNTAKGRVKVRNLGHDPRVALSPGPRQPLPLCAGARTGGRGDRAGRRRAHRRAREEVPRPGQVPFPPAGRGARDVQGQARERAGHVSLASRLRGAVESAAWPTSTTCCTGRRSSPGRR